MDDDKNAGYIITQKIFTDTFLAEADLQVGCIDDQEEAGLQSRSYNYVEQQQQQHQQQQHKQQNIYIDEVLRGEEDDDDNNEQHEGGNNKILHRLYIWYFLLELLNIEGTSELLSWIDEEEMKFKIHDKKKLPLMWGQLHGREDMTYAKFSRALRYHYQKYLKKVPNGRYCYQFIKCQKVKAVTTTIQTRRKGLSKDPLATFAKSIQDVWNKVQGMNIQKDNASQSDKSKQFIDEVDIKVAHVANETASGRISLTEIESFLELQEINEEQPDSSYNCDNISDSEDVSDVFYDDIDIDDAIMGEQVEALDNNFMGDFNRSFYDVYVDLMTCTEPFHDNEDFNFPPTTSNHEISQTTNPKTPIFPNKSNYQQSIDDNCNDITPFSFIDIMQFDDADYYQF